MLISAMTPGPTEPTSEQLQNYLKPIVDDLLELYEDGMIYCTPKHPNSEILVFFFLNLNASH